MEHLDDRHRRQERAAGLEREALVREQSDLVRPTATTSSPGVISSRSARSARARSGCSTRNGSEGLQVTERNGFQKDAGEPAVSPDGRYLYYSKDVTPGQQFEYNKDPNGDDLRDHPARSRPPGTSGAIVSIQGGSITPRPSPGRQVARLHQARARCRASSTCAISTAATTAPCSTHLDKDLQEAWAVHGVYPQYAWMPDGKALVDLGRGQDLARRTSAGARASEIPFTAKVEQTINEARAISAEGRTPEFAVKMLRDVATSPDGKQRRLWRTRADLCPAASDGDPKRADRRPMAFEFVPKWSPDGQWIVYTTWSDAATDACASSSRTAAAGVTS